MYVNASNRWRIGLLLMMAHALSHADPLVIAHRGYSSVAPENTLAAVKRALEIRPLPDFIEIDLHASNDGVLVVSHDDNTMRTTGVSKMIREHAYAELKQLDAGYAEKFGQQFKGETIPRLEEVLDAVKDTGVGIMIECKQLLLEDKVIELLRDRGEIDKHVIASFDELTVYRAKQIEPHVKTLYLTTAIDPTSIWRAKDIQADIIGVNLKTSLESIQLAQQEGFQVWVWTVDEEQDIDRWIAAGADGIISNEPERIVGK